jgi:hypothetical protein
MIRPQQVLAILGEKTGSLLHKGVHLFIILFVNLT